MSEETKQEAPPPQLAAALSPEQRLELARGQHEMSRFKGVSPSDPLNQMVAFAETIVGSMFITEAARNSVPSIVLILATCDDLGIKRTHGIRSLYMTPNGKIGMEGSIMLALLLSNKFQVKILKSTPEEAAYWIKRPKSEGEDAFEFSVEITLQQAKEAGWYSPNKGPWKDPANMLRWRSLAFTARLVAADLLGGIYLPEELAEIEMLQEPDGSFSSAKARADKEADVAAENDAGYAVEVSGRRDPASGLTSQELQNEQFVKNQAKPKEEPAPKPTEKKDDKPTDEGVTIDDAPKVNTDAKLPEKSPEEVADKAQMTARSNAIINAANAYPGIKSGARVGHAMLLTFFQGWHGDTTGAKVVANWNAPIGALEVALAANNELYKELVDKPEALGKKVKKNIESLKIESLKKEAVNSVPAELISAYPTWSNAEFKLAQAVMKKWNMKAPMEFVESFSAFRPIPPVGPDLTACLQMFTIDRHAYMLFKAAVEASISMVDASRMVNDKLPDNPTATDVMRCVTDTATELRAMDKGKQKETSLFD